MFALVSVRKDAVEFNMGAVAIMTIKRFDKARFENYLALLRNINRKQEELAVVNSKISSPSGMRLKEIPVSRQRVNHDKIAFLVQEKIEIEKDIKKLDKYRAEEREELLNAIKKLEDPENFKTLIRSKNVLVAEASVLRLRYFCGCTWPEINETFHGSNEDFDEKKDEYIRKIFRYHGNSFIDLKKVM